ncbi:MAG: hypothetical protein EBZ81_16395 [Betaproteobacteria bacterium]|nr:hypothetical protein [Betaproteobacteria bacterium]
MANMTYCMCENTANDLQAVVDRLVEEGTAWIDDMNPYEVRGLRDIVQLANLIVQMAEDGMIDLRRLGVE